MKKTVEHRGETLLFTIVKSRRYRRFVIRPLGEQRYRISAPAHASARAIDKAIAANIDEVIALPPYRPIPDQIITTKTMPLFGRMFTVAFSSETSAVTSADIVIDVRRHESKRDALIRYLKPRFFEAVHQSLNRDHYKALNPNLEAMRINIRYMRSQFGGCIPAKNTISLNLDLIHYPRRYLTYVIAHELVHFRHHNHNNAFYEKLEQVWPDWQEDRKMLNTFSRLAHHVSIKHLIDDDMSDSLRRSV